MQRRINQLIAERVDVLTLAELLDAQDFVHRTPSRSPRSSELLSLDVKGFVDHALATDSYLNLPDKWTLRGRVILPPDAGGAIQLGGDGEGIERKTVPRTRYLIEALSDRDLDYEVVVGVVEPTMVRRQPYVAFFLPGQHQLVLVCNEEGNATFVVHGVAREAVDSVLETTKSELGMQFPTERIYHVDDPGEWKQTIVDALQRTDLPELRRSRPEISDDASGDWLRVSELAASHGIDVGAVRHWIAPYLAEHPEWLKRFRVERPSGGRGRRYADFIALELVQLVDKKVEAIKKLGPPPENWVSAYEYADMSGIPASSAQQLLGRIVAANPSWGGKHISRSEHQGFRIGLYYSPEATQAADELRQNPVRKAEILAKELPPDGWVAITDLTEEGGRAHNVLTAWARAASTDFPDAMKKYFSTEKQRQTLFVSQQLAEHLRERMKSTPFERRSTKN